MTSTHQRRVGRRDVFISSTTQDLQKHRQAAEDAIYRADLHPLMMESMGASTADAIDFSLAMVDDSEIYIGILGMRYGHIPMDDLRNPHQLSITEMEYRRALANGIEILIFMMHDDHEILARHVETDPAKLTKLNALKEELKNRHVVAFFDSVESLGNKIFQTLKSRRIQDYLAKLDAEATVIVAPSSPTIPIPPQPYHVHPTILPESFVGRSREMLELDDWSHSSDTVYVIEALGGVGKSALTRHWVAQQEAHVPPPFDGIFWWSFYESNATMDRFIALLFAYLSGGAQTDELPRAEREMRVLQLLQQKRYLLIMDGLERALIAYHQLDGLRPDQEPSRDNRRLRSFADPRDDEFLGKLASCAPSKVLISTRLVPQALRGRSLGFLRGVRYRYLKGLEPEDALRLLASLGVHGDPDEIARFTAQFDNHTLLLNVVAGRVASYRPSPGNFGAWYADEGRNLQLSQLDLEQRRTHILRNVLDDLNADLRKLLGQIAAFRYPIDYHTLSRLNPYAPPPPSRAPEPEETRLQQLRADLARLKRNRRNLTTEEAQQLTSLTEQVAALERKIPNQRAKWEAYQKALHDYELSIEKARGQLHVGLTELEERGLLQWDRNSNRYDLHAIVRAYVHETLAADDMRRAYERLRDHFSEMPPENIEQVGELGHLRGSLELYDVLVRLGRLEEAVEVYDRRLKYALQYKLADYQTIVDLLTPLFPTALDGLPRLSAWRQQNICLTDMATALYYLGRKAEATRLRDMKIKLALDHGRHQSLGVALRNYSSSLRLDQNHLAAALRACQLALEVAQVASDPEGIAVSYFYLLGLYSDMGWWTDADKAYQTFYESADGRQRILSKWGAAVERAYAEAQLARETEVSAHLERSLRYSLDDGGRNEVDLREIARLQAEAALAKGNYDVASDFFLSAMTYARKSGLSIAGLQGRLALARALNGFHDEARQLIAEALSISEENRTHDLYNSAAEVYLILSQDDTSRKYALLAHQIAISDGYPYVWRQRLARAEAIFASLGEAPPPVPDYDEKYAVAIPYEQEIRAFLS